MSLARCGLHKSALFTCHYTPTPVICGCASSGTINATILFSFACCIIRIFCVHHPLMLRRYTRRSNWPGYSRPKANGTQGEPSVTGTLVRPVRTLLHAQKGMLTDHSNLIATSIWIAAKFQTAAALGKTNHLPMRHKTN